MLGTLKSTKVTYVRRWGSHLVTLPNFAAWQCDACGHTRYDSAALARINLLFGPDEETLMQLGVWRSRSDEGPGEHGPQRWSF